MKTKTFSKGKGTFAALQSLAVTIQTGSQGDIHRAILAAQSNPLFAKPQAQGMLDRLLTLVISGQPQYAVFKLDGNSKLPFVAFSSLPGVTCPGAGECLSFCYSYRAWRFAHSFGRQAQNAYLMRFNRPAISQALQSAAAHFDGADFDLRLYVDGDFATLGCVAYWQAQLLSTPTAKAYGYSKSFAELLRYHRAGGQWAPNYKLNISSGHAHSAETLAAVKALPCARGEFIAVSIGRMVKGHEHGTKPVNTALRAAFGARAFTCPGTCGNCTPKGHACGSEAFKNIPIIIATH